MDPQQAINELKRYESELTAILSRFVQTDRSLHIRQTDDPIYRQYVREILDLFNDLLGRNHYSAQIANEANEGVANWVGSPSYKSVENIIGVMRAALTRLNRNPDLLTRRNAQSGLRRRQNVFLVHGRDEAKWRELKDIVQNDFRLNPIVLQEQPDTGAKTVIEKFEHYAETCSYAIAIFTPDDEVSAGEKSYLQARPNVIYELGWFCGKLGRSGAMLLLKEGTSMFSDFGGILEKRFAKNVSEKTNEIRSDLIVAGVLDEV